MKKLTVWAPNAAKVELVRADTTSFVPALDMVATKVDYKNTSMSGYWTLPAGVDFPLADGDGYWFKITLKSGELKFRIDPYARAMQHSCSHSIYKDPDRFAWTDENFTPPAFDSMVIYQLFQGGYVGRGDADWKDPSGHNYHFEWSDRRKGTSSS